MVEMYEDASVKKLSKIGDIETFSVKCPFCRAFSLIYVGKDKDYIQVDEEYQMLLKDVFEEEFKQL